MRRGAVKDKQFKRYLSLARRTVKKANDHALDFNVKWLDSLEGVIAWMELNRAVTTNQKRAIRNSSRAVDNMVRYKRLVERRKAKRERKALDGTSEATAEGDAAAQ